MPALRDEARARSFSDFGQRIARCIAHTGVPQVPASEVADLALRFVEPPNEPDALLVRICIAAAAAWRELLLVDASACCARSSAPRALASRPTVGPRSSQGSRASAQAAERAPWCLRFVRRPWVRECGGRRRRPAARRRTASARCRVKRLTCASRARHTEWQGRSPLFERSHGLICDPCSGDVTRCPLRPRSTTGRDSQPKYLGVKVYGGGYVEPGNIIIRQRGQK